jgi:hypothetical protein
VNRRRRSAGGAFQITRQVVAILLMVATVVAGAFGVIAARASDAQVDAARDVEVATVRVLDERARAAGKISAEQQAENTAAEQRANARALASHDATALGLQAERRGAIEAARAAGDASELGSGHSVLRETTAVAERFKQRQRRQYQRAFEYANAYDQQSQQLSDKVASLLAVIAVFAIGVFLIGLTLAVSQPAARKVLLGTGVALVLVVTAWGVIAASAQAPRPSAGAIEAYLRGLELRRAAFAEISGGPGRDPRARALMRRSIRDSDEAIHLRPDYGAAYFSRALAYTVLAFTDPAGAHGSTRARNDYRRANELGYERQIVLNNLALQELRLGDIDAGIDAARAAVALRPNISNSNETLASLLRYDAAQPTPAYREQLRRLRETWAQTDAKRRNDELARAIEGTQEIAEQYPRLAARARSYRADLERIARDLDRR